MSSRCLQDMPGRLLQYMSWRHFEDTSYRCLQDMSSRRLQDMFSRCPQDVLESNKMFTEKEPICVSNKSKSASVKPMSNKSISDEYKANPTHIQGPLIRYWLHFET